MTSTIIIPAFTEISQWALASLAAYGISILLFLTFIGSLGIPFPVTLVVIAAGAFSRQGLLDWRLALLAGMAGAVLADNSEYLAGHLASARLNRLFNQKPAWQQAKDTFNRQGGWAIMLTRFWLTSLAPAVNLVAGSRYPYKRFLFFDLAGQLLWVLLYGGLGYVFASQWQLVGGIASRFSLVSFAAATLVGVFFIRAKKKQSHVS